MVSRPECRFSERTAPNPPSCTVGPYAKTAFLGYSDPPNLKASETFFFAYALTVQEPPAVEPVEDVEDVAKRLK